MEIHHEPNNTTTTFKLETTQDMKLKFKNSATPIKQERIRNVFNTDFALKIVYYFLIATQHEISLLNHPV